MTSHRDEESWCLTYVGEILYSKRDEINLQNGFLNSMSHTNKKSRQLVSIRSNTEHCKHPAKHPLEARDAERSKISVTGEGSCTMEVHGLQLAGSSLAQHPSRSTCTHSSCTQADNNSVQRVPNNRAVCGRRLERLNNPPPAPPCIT